MPTPLRRLINLATRPASTDLALRRTFVPIAIGQMLASAESLTVRRLYGPKAVLRGVSARYAKPNTLRHSLLRTLDSEHTPMVLAGVALAASTALLVSGRNRRLQIGASAVIALCNRLSELRTPYGRDGADQMTAVITQYRVATSLVRDQDRSDDLFLRAVNLQAAMSYLSSGVAKLFGSAWVQGDALGDILHTEVYGGSPLARVLRRYPGLARVLTWVTPLWEVGFPAVYLLSPGAANVMLAGVKAFHIGVAGVMELPRFVWGFFGSHGAVQYVIDRPRFAHRRFSRVEATTLTAVVAATLVSATYAVTTRQADQLRRKGLKGSATLSIGDGEIEYVLTQPEGVTNPPIVLLENGLGTALETWGWVRDALASDYAVLAYHRSGYGLSTSTAKQAQILDGLLGLIESDGPMVVVSHSIGSVYLAAYAEELARPVRGVVIVDGTDPKLFEAERSDRRRLGSFLQAQLHTLFAALTGIYNFAPNAIARQSSYVPDLQAATVQFSFSPRTIVRSTLEYFRASTDGVIESLRAVPVRRLVASREHGEQQKTFAEAIGATYRLVDGSTHRSILGNRVYALQVAEEIRAVVQDA